MTRLDRLAFPQLLQVQRRLYEQASGRTDEPSLTALVLGYDAAQDSGFACDPDFPVYPAAIAARVHALPREEHALLTRILFAMEKQNVAQNEMITLTWNTRSAERAFGLYSDAWWVQHRETQDEHDHIHGFELLARQLLGEGLSAEELARKNRFRDHSFAVLDEVLASPRAVPALYFQLRFLANTFLKMVEGFCFDPRRTDIAYSDALARINKLHHDEEARHFTSSWAFGQHLYSTIDDPREQELVRAVVTFYLGIHIRFLAVGGHHVRTGLEALGFALRSGALPSLRLSPGELAAAYAGFAEPVDLDRSRRRASCRWGASQLRKLETALQIGLDDYAFGSLHPDNAAILQELRGAVLANGTVPQDELPFADCYRAYEAMLGAA